MIKNTNKITKIYGGIILKRVFKFLMTVSVVIILTACNMGSLDRSKIISAPKDYELTILFLGDTNGQIEGGVNTGIGYSRYSTILERARKEFGKENVIYLDAGNTFTGGPIADKDKGESVVKILNALGLDAMTLGKNDFKYGENHIKSLEFKANFKIVAANIKNQNNQNFVTPYIIKEVRGTKVGIFGIVSPEIYDSENTLDTITIEEPILAASKAVKDLKSEGAEFIIALSSLGTNPDTNREWLSTTLAETVSGIDLIIDGNSKMPLEDKLMINNTAIVQVGENLVNVGVLKIDFDASKRDSERFFYKIIKKSDIVMAEEEEMNIPAKNENKSSVPRFITHTVVKGDTLYSLARTYGTTVDNIVSLNPSIINGQINIGQTYVMVADKVTQKKKSSVKSSTKSNYIEHTVVKGDTLYSLARNYGTTVDEVLKLNPEITDGQSIKIGQSYKFPTNKNVENQIENNMENNSPQEDFTEERLSSDFPEVTSKYRTSVPTGIAKDPKIETLIAKIKNAQSFVNTGVEN